MSFEAHVIVDEVPGGLVPDSSYSTAKRQFVGEDKKRDVLLRRFETNMQELFSLRESFKNNNIQQVYDFVLDAEKQESAWTCEKVDMKLSTWLRQRNTERKPVKRFIKKKLEEVDYDALVCRFMSQMTNALDFLHKKGYCHGPMSCDDLYLYFNRHYKPHHLEYYNLKLTLSGYEKCYLEKNSVVELKNSALKTFDWQGLASVLNLVVHDLPVKRSADFGILRRTLNRCTSFDNYALNKQPCTWNDAQKIRLINVMTPLPPSGNNAETSSRASFFNKHWRITYQPAINAVNQWLKEQELGTPRYLDDGLDYFVRFMDNTFRHYHEYPPELQAHFGSTVIDVLHRFEQFHPSLIEELMGIADRVGVLNAFANELY